MIANNFRKAALLAVILSAFIAVAGFASVVVHTGSKTQTVALPGHPNGMGDVASGFRQAALRDETLRNAPHVITMAPPLFRATAW